MSSIYDKKVTKKTTVNPLVANIKKTEEPEEKNYSKKESVTEDNESKSLSKKAKTIFAKPAKKSIALYLSDEVIKAVDVIRKENKGASRSSIIEQLLQESLKKYIQ